MDSKVSSLQARKSTDLRGTGGRMVAQSNREISEESSLSKGSVQADFEFYKELPLTCVITQVFAKLNRDNKDLLNLL